MSVYTKRAWKHIIIENFNERQNKVSWAMRRSSMPRIIQNSAERKYERRGRSDSIAVIRINNSWKRRSEIVLARARRVWRNLSQ